MNPYNNRDTWVFQHVTFHFQAELDKIKEILSIARKNEQQTTKNHEEALARLKDLEHINALKIKELENLKDAQSLERTSQEKARMQKQFGNRINLFP